MEGTDFGRLVGELVELSSAIPLAFCFDDISKRSLDKRALRDRERKSSEGLLTEMRCVGSVFTSGVRSVHREVENEPLLRMSAICSFVFTYRTDRG